MVLTLEYGECCSTIHLRDIKQYISENNIHLHLGVAVLMLFEELMLMMVVSIADAVDAWFVNPNTLDVIAGGSSD